MGIVLLILLGLLLLASWPQWEYARGWGWGYAPSAGIGLVMGIVLILVIAGKL